ncbi:hypothetical protein QAD02_017995, partial [Eretmocerus hayati]
MIQLGEGCGISLMMPHILETSGQKGEGAMELQKDADAVDIGREKVPDTESREIRSLASESSIESELTVKTLTNSPASIEPASVRLSKFVNNLMLHESSQQLRNLQTSSSCSRLCYVILERQDFSTGLHTGHSQDLRQEGFSKFYCIICKIDLKCKSTYEKHSSKHSVEYSSKNECSNENHLKSHSETAEPKDFCCDVCGVSCVRKDFLMEHIKLHSTVPRLLYCDTCKKGFPSRWKMVNHLHSHSTVKSFPCKLCGAKFKKGESFKLHSESRTLESTSCKVCHKIFRSKNSLLAHMKQHHKGGKLFSCEVCKRIFEIEEEFEKQEKKIHQTQLLYECDTCGKAFTEKKTLRKHMRVHENVKAFKCKVCAKDFRYRGNLKTHSMQHTGEWIVFCKICDKGFPHSDNLEKHVRTHTGEKPHPCDICDVLQSGNHDVEKNDPPRRIESPIDEPLTTECEAFAEDCLKDEKLRIMEVKMNDSGSERFDSDNDGATISELDIDAVDIDCKMTLEDSFERRMIERSTSNSLKVEFEAKTDRSLEDNKPDFLAEGHEEFTPTSCCPAVCGPTEMQNAITSSHI